MSWLHVTSFWLGAGACWTHLVPWLRVALGLRGFLHPHLLLHVIPRGHLLDALELERVNSDSVMVIQLAEMSTCQDHHSQPRTFRSRVCPTTHHPPCPRQPVENRTYVRYCLQSQSHHFRQQWHRSWWVLITIGSTPACSYLLTCSSTDQCLLQASHPLTVSAGCFRGRHRRC